MNEVATKELVPSGEMEAAYYHAAPGLSNSGMKDLAVSPLRYWHLHVNPNRPAKKETPEMRFGTALHCAVLEPFEFENRYARELSADDIDGCLVTANDLREWLKSKGLPSSGRTKDELIDRVILADQHAPIFDRIEQRYAERNAGRIMLSREDWSRVYGASNALWDEPRVAELLRHGKPEFSTFARDPETGVILKARMDWVAPEYTVDAKTFSQKRGKSIDRSVTDAIYHEAYYRQAYFYTYLRSLIKPHAPQPRFVFAFVESEEPYEVRIRELTPARYGNPNLYWERAAIEVRGFINTYADYAERFGEKPWREPRTVDVLNDGEIPALSY